MALQPYPVIGDVNRQAISSKLQLAGTDADIENLKDKGLRILPIPQCWAFGRHAVLPIQADGPDGISSISLHVHFSSLQIVEDQPQGAYAGWIGCACVSSAGDRFGGF